MVTSRHNTQLAYASFAFRAHGQWLNGIGRIPCIRNIQARIHISHRTLLNQRVFLFNLVAGFNLDSKTFFFNSQALVCVYWSKAHILR